MTIFRSVRPPWMLFRIIFLLLPTLGMFGLILENASGHYSILENQWFQQTMYVGLGMMIGFSLAAFRFRLAPLLFGGIFLFVIIYQLLEGLSSGEFDSFFTAVRFKIFSVLFWIGWLCGWGITRYRHFPILIASLLLIINIILVSRIREMQSVAGLIRSLGPLLIYALYMPFTRAGMDMEPGRFWPILWRFTRRLFGFLLLVLLILWSVTQFMYPKLEAGVANWGAGAGDGENQMLENQQDGKVQNRQQMGMGYRNQRNKNPEPVFCAHIPHFLPGTEIPNPLYLTAWHFTRFDTLTETFERDTLNPFNDEFHPDISKIPLFSTLSDSSRMVQGRSKLDREMVDIEVYKKRLSAAAFLAPSTAWSVQPISVERDFKQEFSSAYKARSYVSALNSAYFIYNTDQPEIKQFQEQRFARLRKVKGYDTLDPAFLKYYTFFPSGSRYEGIRRLADSLSNNKTFVIDKVLQVRDYFLQRDETGERLFEYADNPGVPGLPSASRLMHFLFESRKGYCAYYAGATVFLLRAMGIPCRVVTGFMTIDRSDKNPGWYWFYEDQSHGWVQVFFPGYGWIDFDTTIGNEEAQQSPSPDGTPPLPPTKPQLVAGGKILRIDTLSKQLILQLESFMLHDKEYKVRGDTLQLFAQNSLCWLDTQRIDFNHLRTGHQIMAISYQERLKQVNASSSLQKTMQQLPHPVEVDEIYLRPESETNQEKQAGKASVTDYKWLIVKCGFVLLLLILILFSIPTLTYRFMRYRALQQVSSLRKKAYYQYYAAMFLLHQLGYPNQQQSVWEYAKHIDQQLGTTFNNFVTNYFQIKYASTLPVEVIQQQVTTFWPSFEKQIHTKITPWQRCKSFLNLNVFINFYLNPLKRNDHV